MTPAARFDVATRLGSNLRRLRRRVALSQEQLASLASIHRTEVGLLENGDRLPRIDTLVKLAASLEATPNDLLDGIGWVPNMHSADGSFFIARHAATESPGTRHEKAGASVSCSGRRASPRPAQSEE